MKYSVFIELEGGFDSRMLYALLSPYKFSATDLGDKVSVYGECDENIMPNIIVYCARYGEVKASIKTL